MEDVAKHLGTARDTVYRWTERKGLPAHPVGRLGKLKGSEVDESLRQGGAGPDDDEDDPEQER